MAYTIFCPNTHLILDAPRCPQCGWTRPVSAAVGQPAWNPVALKAGLGGEGRNVLAEPAVVDGVVAFPLRNGELVGLCLDDGQPLWRIALEAGRMTRRLAVDHPGKRFLASISDERMIEKAETGYLAEIVPQTGKLNPIWKSTASQLSAPTLTDDLILLRTSDSELVALALQFKPEALWRQSLQAWWPVAPFVAGDRVFLSDGRAMQGEGFFQAHALKNGQPVWKTPPATDGLLAHAPTATNEVVIIQNSRHTLTALDILGRTLWQTTYPRLYTPPVIFDEKVFVVVRGPDRNREKSDYRLYCLEPKSGKLLWELSLPDRVRIPPIWEDGVLYLGTDEGRILAYDTLSRALLWAFALGSHENPIHTTLTLSGDVLVVGAYEGQVAVIQVRRAAEKIEPPEVYTQAGEYEDAAVSFALTKKDFRKAADLYAMRLNAPQKALALLEYAGLYQEAGDLARDSKMYAEAQVLYRKGNLVNAEINLLLEIGDTRAAANRAEEVGDLVRAAELYEKLEEFGRAQKLYRELNDFSNSVRLGFTHQLKFDVIEVEQLEKKGLLREAGEVALRMNFLEKAVDLFRRAELPEKQLEVLQLLTEKSPETWSLTRLTELTRKMGRFYLEAQTWEKLGQEQKAAEAYLRAAEQKEFNEPEAEAEIARLYERATHFFEESGMAEKYKACFQKVIHYQYLPNIIVSIETQKVFKVGEFNSANIFIENIGRGIAHNIRVEIGNNRFETEATTGLFLIRRLAPAPSSDARITGQLSIYPLEGQVGEAVPLQLKWHWMSRDGQSFEEELSTPVKVVGKDESKSSGPPVIIHAEHYTHVEGTYAAHDYIAGNQVQGDMLTGDAQKGDKVEIHRGEGKGQIHLQPEVPATPKQPCPNCKSPVEKGAKFCDACGQKI